jgi:hypothetical protein
LKKLTELTHTEARQYFLKQENYCNVDLPKYFDFQPLLDALALNGNLNNIALGDAKKIDSVNYKFLTNKDGKFAWRPLQLINPAIYVNLVNKITKEENWNFIVNRFKRFQKNNKIKCYSIPITSTTNEKSDKAGTILNWWQQLRQQSL